MKQLINYYTSNSLSKTKFFLVKLICLMMDFPRGKQPCGGKNHKVRYSSMNKQQQVDIVACDQAVPVFCRPFLSCLPLSYRHKLFAFF